MRDFLLRNYKFYAVCFAFSLVAIPAFGYGLKFGHVLITFFLLVASPSRGLFVTLLLFVAIPAMLYAPFGYMLGAPDLNALLSLEETHKSEALEFLRAIPLRFWMLPPLIVFLTIQAFKLRRDHHRELKVYAVAFTLLLLTPGKSVLLNVFNDNEKTVKPNFPPARFFYDAWHSSQLIAEDKLFFIQQLGKYSTWEPRLTEVIDRTIVVVIGESVRRSYMSTYGFGMITTPWMDNQPGLVFTDYISAGPATVLSLTNSLYQRGSEGINYQNSVVSLLRGAGWSVHWISNQGSYGEYDTRTALMARQATSAQFLKKGRSNDSDHDDIELLPLVRNSIRAKGNKVIFVHLMGSHPSACDRTHDQYDVFFNNKEMSCYLQTLRNTDAFLKRVSEELADALPRWTLMYFADHGVRLFDKGHRNERLAHSDGYQENYDVPLFITHSSNATRRYITEPRSGFDLMAIIAQLAGVKEPTLRQHCDYLINVQCSSPRAVLNGAGKLVDYDLLKTDVNEVVK